MQDEVLQRVTAIIAADPVVLFMKGTPGAPQCGFSADIARLLLQLGVAFSSVNVLADQDLREGVKRHANWPTIPQLYIGGEFIGGADIAREMLASGELVALLQAANVKLSGLAP